LNNLIELFLSVGIDVDGDFLEIVLFLFTRFSFFKLVLNPFANHLISSISLTSLEVLDQDVSEFRDMTGVFQDDAWSDASTVDFEHVLFKNEEFSPELFDVVLDSTANGSEVIQSCTASVNFESLEVNVSSLDEVIQEFFVFE
jgi:hypothetical protein